MSLTLKALLIFLDQFADVGAPLPPREALSSAAS